MRSVWSILNAASVYVFFSLCLHGTWRQRSTFNDITHEKKNMKNTYRLIAYYLIILHTIYITERILYIRIVGGIQG